MARSLLLLLAGTLGLLLTGSNGATERRSEEDYKAPDVKINPSRSNFLNAENAPDYEQPLDPEISSATWDNANPFLRQSWASFIPFVNPIDSETKVHLGLLSNVADRIRTDLSVVKERQDVLLKFAETVCPNAEHCQRVPDLQDDDLEDYRARLFSWTSDNPNTLVGVDKLFVVMNAFKNSVEKLTLRQNVLYEHVSCSCNTNNECNSNLKPILEVMFSNNAYITGELVNSLMTGSKGSTASLFLHHIANLISKLPSISGWIGSHLNFFNPLSSILGTNFFGGAQSSSTNPTGSSSGGIVSGLLSSIFGGNKPASSSGTTHHEQQGSVSVGSGGGYVGVGNTGFGGTSGVGSGDLGGVAVGGLGGGSGLGGVVGGIGGLGGGTHGYGGAGGGGSFGGTESLGGIGNGGLSFVGGAGQGGSWNTGGSISSKPGGTLLFHKPGGSGSTSYSGGYTSLNPGSSETEGTGGFTGAVGGGSFGGGAGTGGSWSLEGSSNSKPGGPLVFHKPSGSGYISSGGYTSSSPESGGIIGGIGGGIDGYGGAGGGGSYGGTGSLGGVGGGGLSFGGGAGAGGSWNTGGSSVSKPGGTLVFHKPGGGGSSESGGTGSFGGVGGGGLSFGGGSVAGGSLSIGGSSSSKPGGNLVLNKPGGSGYTSVTSSESSETEDSEIDRSGSNFYGSLGEAFNKPTSGHHTVNNPSGGGSSHVSSSYDKRERGRRVTRQAVSALAQVVAAGNNAALATYQGASLSGFNPWPYIVPIYNLAAHIG